MLAERDGLVAAHQHAVFDVVAQAARQHGLLDVASVAHRVLLDDGACIQLVGDVMAGRAYEFHAALIGLVIRSRTDEGRQEAVMDVDEK
jgi:hypothetical protein